MTSSDTAQHTLNEDTAVTDVLSSIRRALNEDHTSTQPPAREDTQAMSDHTDELTLDSSMMVAPPVTTGKSGDQASSGNAKSSGSDASAPEKDDLMNAQTVAAAERSLDELHAALSGSAPLASETVISKSSGLTIEDMVRGEVRSMVRTWLDAHLPSLVEILVRAEIARLRPRE